MKTSFKYAKLWLLLVCILSIAKGAGQDLLSRPHLAAYGDEYNEGLFGMDISATKKYWGSSLYIQPHNFSKPHMQGYINYSFYSSWDTLDLKHDRFFSRNLELGLGYTKEHKYWHWQGIFGLGNDYFKYRCYDTNKIARSMVLQKIVVSYQFSTGYFSDNFEFGISFKTYGYANWYRKQNIEKITPKTENQLTEFDYQNSNLIIEPGAYMVIKDGKSASLKMAVRAPMVRDAYNQFKMPKRFYYSLGMFYSI